MHQLILENFAMHIALAPHEQEQALAFFQLREVRKRHPGLERRIAQKHIASYLGITPAFLSMMRKESGI